MEPSLWAELRRKGAEQAGTWTEYLRARLAAPVVRLINRGGSMLVLYKFYLMIKKNERMKLWAVRLSFFPSSRCLLASLYLVHGGFLSFSRMQLICSQNRFLSRWWCNWTITGNDPQLHRATSQSISSTPIFGEMSRDDLLKVNKFQSWSIWLHATWSTWTDTYTLYVSVFSTSFIHVISFNHICIIFAKWRFNF